jgi:hypothetical protein
MNIDSTPNTNATINNNTLYLIASILVGIFSLNNEETITSADFIFLLGKKIVEFNYTTFVINNSGEFYHDSLINNPQTF